jgi:spore germination protein KC
LKRILCLILCKLILLTLTGCWSRKEPEDLALINSALYDLSDSGGYQIILEILNPSAGGVGQNSSNSHESPNMTTISEGNSISEAIMKATISLERIIFGGNNKVRFISHRLAENGIIPLMDFLLRDKLADENPLLVVIKNEQPSQIYTCMLGLSETVGEYIESLRESEQKSIAGAVFIKTLDFVKDYYNEGKQPVAGVAEIVECESKPSQNTNIDNSSQSQQNNQGEPTKRFRIAYAGLAAFKEDKLVGYLDEIETRAYNFITNKVKNSIVTFVTEEKQTVVAEVAKPKAKLETEIIDDRIAVNISIKAKLTIIEEGSTGNTDNANISNTKSSNTASNIRFETAFNKHITEDIKSVVKKAQNDFESDIFGFGTFVHRQHPEIWKQIKNRWSDYFKEAIVNVTVDSTVFNTGEIKLPFERRLEE